MLIQIDEREHASLLAGLRALQMSIMSRPYRWRELEEILTNGDAVPPLTEPEIDDLCERINMHTPPVIGIGINMAGGNIESVFTDTECVNFNCIQCDYDDDAEGPRTVMIAEDGYNDSKAYMGKHTVACVPDDFAVYVDAQARADAQEKEQCEKDGVPF